MITNRKIGKAWEEYYPYIVPVPTVFVICKVMGKYNITYSADSFNAVLGAIITFSSIVIGFTGTMLAILATLRESEIIKYLADKGFNNKIRQFTRIAILSGSLVICLSCILYIQAFYLVKCLWATIVIFFMLCEYRIISLWLKILFINPDVQTPGNNRLSDREGKEIQERLSASKDTI